MKGVYEAQEGPAGSSLRLTTMPSLARTLEKRVIAAVTARTDLMLNILDVKLKE